MLEMARLGRPFLMNVQTNAVTRRRMDLYRKTMRDAGFDEDAIARNVDETWVWRNIFVAESDAEAERVAVPLFEAQRAQRAAMRERVAAERGESLVKKTAETGAAPARNVTEHSLICGSPATVAERIAEIDKIGVGGIILQFRVGPAPADVAENSLKLFMTQVAPEFRKRKAA